jgi:exosortase/archaeosortase family protein
MGARGVTPSRLRAAILPPAAAQARLAPVAVWLALALVAGATAYRTSVAQVAAVAADPLRVVDQRMVHLWGVLALVLAGLLMKGRAIAADLPPVVRATRARFGWLALGLVSLAGSAALPPPGALLAGLLGLFAICCGGAARWPAYLMGVYLVGAAFPLMAERWLDAPLGIATAAPVAGILHAAGYPIARSGYTIATELAGGQVIQVLITAACAGPATLGVFIAIFALMAADVRVGWRTGTLLFAIGVAGVYAQNVLRVVYLLLVGRYQGEAAMWAAHADSGYFWFISWYVAFAALYLGVAARQRRRGRAAAPETYTAGAPTAAPIEVTRGAHVPVAGVTAITTAAQ